jgi:multidrug resistance protein, MATE family
MTVAKPNEKTRLLDGQKPSTEGDLEMQPLKPVVKPMQPEKEPKSSVTPSGGSVSGGVIPLRQELIELSSMAIQFSLRQMVRQAMTITDDAFQGHIGTKQLAGVALAAMWMGVPSTFIQFSIQAINTLCSQAYGAGNNTLVGIWLQTAIVFAVVGAIPVMIWYLCVGHFISITMDDAETVAFGSQFAMIMALGLIPQYIYGACSTYFASQGIIMPATICSVVTMLSNIAFNQFFIYGAFGWKGLGFIGSPIATVMSTCLQLTLFLSYTVLWKGYHKPYWGGWTRESLRRDRLQVFLSLAIPMGASSVVDWASATVAGAFSGFLGPNIAASQAVLGGVFGVTNSAVSGFSTSTQIRMSRYLGKGNAFAAKRVLYLGGSIVLGGAVAMLVVVTLLRHHIFTVWSNDPVILAMCADALVVFVVCILVAFVRFLLTAVLNALSLAQINLWANNFASWCVYVPLSYVLPITLGWGLDGFWWADTFGEMVKVVVLVWGVSRVNWTDAARRAQRAAEADHQGSGGDSEDDEKRQVLAYENEALVGRTPESFRTPSTVMTPSSANHTPNARRKARELLARRNSMDVTPKRATDRMARTPDARAMRG